MGGRGGAGVYLVSSQVPCSNAFLKLKKTSIKLIVMIAYLFVCHLYFFVV